MLRATVIEHYTTEKRFPLQSKYFFWWRGKHVETHCNNDHAQNDLVYISEI